MASVARQAARTLPAHCTNAVHAPPIRCAGEKNAVRSALIPVSAVFWAPPIRWYQGKRPGKFSGPPVSAVTIYRRYGGPGRKHAGCGFRTPVWAGFWTPPMRGYDREMRRSESSHPHIGGRGGDGFVRAVNQHADGSMRRRIGAIAGRTARNQRVSRATVSTWHEETK